MNTVFPNSEDQLAKYFAGELSEKEVKEIEAWAKKSPENQELLLQYRIIWADTGKINHQPLSKTHDVEAAWQKVKSGKKDNNKISRPATWLWKVAAGMALLIGIGFLFRSFLTKPDQLIYQAESSVVNIDLKDGSKILLNKNSKLIYPERFEPDLRTVRLEGEAFFEVDHRPNQPFIVQAGPTQIKVLGTSFNIKIENDKVRVEVESGKVLFSANENQVTLTAGEKAVYESKSGTFNKETIMTGSMGLGQYWRTKTLKFSGEKLPEVARALEQVYEIPIELKGEALKNCSLIVTFENDSLDNIINVIALTLNLEVDRSDNHITLSGKGCPEK